ncbi:ABC transporter ATP-binding protein [Tianweitania sp. BSSL-BM11]|uniref:ABC transporter ATP-binding protein n=1 Tax=Tianweitania aestuarii TaxID=2814886 RepID=A0ABS5RSC6_9HYPH|nr:ABC transporter ATP-binding protein [Tianweitania aestuarii]MBS9719705.1 ABC transporter ATP-binding protein [Tianweitania aestuarii]
MSQAVSSNVKGASIEIKHLGKTFGNVKAVNDVSLTINAGEFVALLGPSGSGKSTVLMSIAGFERPSEGQILIGGQDCTRLPPNKRNIGMVFQHYTLFPHLSVGDNVAFPLKMRGVAKAERRRQAEAALEVVRLGGYGDRTPNQLSGGQQQRVALARAIVYNPQVLLMDEPLSALDKNLREEMQIEIKRLHAELGFTVVFVTHDQGEALTMADRIAILKAGRLQQVSQARELYERPSNLFAASFIGEMNMLPVRWDGVNAVFSDQDQIRLPDTASIQPVRPGSAILAIRPERLSIAAPGTEGSWKATVRDVVYAGAGSLLITHLADGSEVRLRVASAGQAPIRPGQEIGIKVPPEAALLYPADASQ